MRPLRLVGAAALATALLTPAPAVAADGRGAEARSAERAGGGASSLLRMVALEHSTEALPTDHPVDGELGRTGLDLSLPVARGLRLVSGLRLEYVNEHGSGYREVSPTPRVALELRF